MLNNCIEIKQRGLHPTWGLSKESQKRSLFLFQDDRSGRPVWRQSDFSYLISALRKTANVIIFSETTIGHSVHVATFCRDFTVPMVNGWVTLRTADAVDPTTYLINTGIVMLRTSIVRLTTKDGIDVRRIITWLVYTEEVVTF